MTLSAGQRDTLVVADLHLDAARPAVTVLALRFLEAARGAKALWIIGDLFETWLGDDVIEPAHAPVIDALAAVAAGGTAVHLMHGNRDFLLGEAFAARVGGTLHREDEHVLALGGEPCVLLHGDTLCTGDVDYQGLRAMLRAAPWQAEFLARTPVERREAARALRETSREAVAGKAGGLMDVAPEAVREAFERSGCRTMIHGHTHRPADHVDADRGSARGATGGTIDGLDRDAGRRGGEAAGTRRVVVGDWHDDHARYARHDGTALTLEIWR